ncbi:flagellar basal body rod protein FlgB [Asticcacaulis excentricus]|uniref:Flagellar basal body rod protein FlgB n=1 Tax=Asticcacaulis excentricus (strain ATCC 15261 / DSM 4724 / KCTC 12464 / NCIMB 9791 / VKM B-1370 / CB 48) TaxID=573065 RepID=E8RPJ1_ASTEC|nr:flagellar basal body rod protein FlgB [Asticcacaulis excentricus]ADU13089.1 flagellar basal-body rod protein FlgB [Asticcacaulis excentricus CB 48]
MSTENIGLLGALKEKMTWLGQRQKLVAQNVANASTPGFKPRDLKALDFASVLKGQQEQTELGLSVTNAGHMNVEGGNNFAPKAVVSPDSETTMDGNSVVLEEQMLKMAESRMQYEAALGFYQKSLGLIRMATKAPGK